MWVDALPIVCLSVGLVAGLVFGYMIGITRDRHKHDDMQLPKVTEWGPSKELNL